MSVVNFLWMGERYIAVKEGTKLAFIKRVDCDIALSVTSYAWDPSSKGFKLAEEVDDKRPKTKRVSAIKYEDILRHNELRNDSRHIVIMAHCSPSITIENNVINPSQLIDHRPWKGCNYALRFLRLDERPFIDGLVPHDLSSRVSTPGHVLAGSTKFDKKTGNQTREACKSQHISFAQITDTSSEGACNRTWGEAAFDVVRRIEGYGQKAILFPENQRYSIFGVALVKLDGCFGTLNDAAHEARATNAKTATGFAGKMSEVTLQGIVPLSAVAGVFTFDVGQTLSQRMSSLIDKTIITVFYNAVFNPMMNAEEVARQQMNKAHASFADDAEAVKKMYNKLPAFIEATKMIVSSHQKLVLNNFEEVARQQMNKAHASFADDAEAVKSMYNKLSAFIEDTKMIVSSHHKSVLNNFEEVARQEIARRQHEEAARRQREEAERQEALRQQAHRQEIARRQREEAERQEALRQQAYRQREEAARRQREEEARRFCQHQQQRDYRQRYTEDWSLSSLRDAADQLGVNSNVGGHFSRTKVELACDLNNAYQHQQQRGYRQRYTDSMSLSSLRDAAKQLGVNSNVGGHSARTKRELVRDLNNA